MPSQTVKNGLDAKKMKFPLMKFFLKKKVMYLIAPFIQQDFKRTVRADPELSECVIFGHKIAHLF